MEETLSKEELKLRKMTNEPVQKLVLKLAVPTIISMLITTFYNLVDTFYVKQLKVDSMIAAVGVVLPLMNLIQAFGFFCGHGSGNYISRAFGRKDYKNAEKMAATGFVYGVFIGLIIMTFGLIFRKGLVVGLGAKTEATTVSSIDYMTYILLAAPFMTGSIVLNNQLRLQGNAFFAMLGLTTGAIINIILDPIFIFKSGDVLLDGLIVVKFGAGMGVGGAALATAISQVVSFVILFIGVNKSDNVKIHLKNFTISPKFMYSIFQGGFPSLARQGLASVANLSLNHSIGMFVIGDEAIDCAQAAITSAQKIMNFFASALIGYGQGFQPVCGINYGAGKPQRVKKAYWFCVNTSFIALVIVSAICYIFAKPIIGFIAGTSEGTIEIATLTFRIQLIMLPFMAFVTMTNMMLQTCGKVLPATIVAASRQGITFVPLVFLLPLLFNAIGLTGILGIQHTQAISDILSFIICIPITWYELKKISKECI